VGICREVWEKHVWQVCLKASNKIKVSGKSCGPGKLQNCMSWGCAKQSVGNVVCRVCVCVCVCVGCVGKNCVCVWLGTNGKGKGNVVLGSCVGMWAWNCVSVVELWAQRW